MAQLWWSWAWRVVGAMSVAAGLVFLACEPAAAVTLTLRFPDGQPMTYGSACSGVDCLRAVADLQSTDADGEIVLADAPDHIVGYRRDGIDLSLVPKGQASGRLEVTGSRAAVVLHRLLVGSAPAVDAVESELVTRINEQRGVRGLPPAQLNARLSTAADLQATWLSSSSIGLPLPVLSHRGPYGSTLAFRLGEVSFPEPAFGAEIASAGATPAQAMVEWLASAPHRDVMLAPGAQLIGVAIAGSVIIIDTHPPCSGCRADAAPGGTLAAGATTGPGSPRAQNAPLAGSSHDTPSALSGAAPSCGAEQLRVQRLRNQRRRLRVRVHVRCLRSGASYSLSVVQRPSRSVIARRKIAGPATITLGLRPASDTRVLSVKLKRNGRAIAARSVTKLR